MHARNLIVRFVLVLLIWSDISSVFAAPPTPPSGFLAGGIFAQYFKNIVEGGLGVGTCPVGQSVIGFNTGASSLYGLPVCQAIASSQWTTNGSNIYYTGGNVGIKTTTPSYALQVQKTSIASPAIMVGGGYARGPRIQTYGLDADGNAYMGLGTDMAGGPYESSIYYPLSGPGKLTFGTYDGTTYSEKMRLDGNGNLGIGTASPTAKLEVNGYFKATNVVYGLNTTKTSYAGDFNAMLPSGFYNDYNVNGQPYAGTWFHLITNRHVNESNQYEFQLTSDFSGGGRNSYVRTIEGGTVQPWRQIITAESNGNVGIGTTTPGQKLSVAGTVESTTGGFKFPDGTTQITASAIPSVISHLGRVSAETGRNTLRNGVYTFGTYTTTDAGGNPPFTYPEILAWGEGSAGTIQIAGDWVSGGTTPLAVRSLRDCCTNWSPWVKIITEDTNGYVGIGTTTPGQKLTVVGTIQSTTGGFKFPDGTTQTTAANGATLPSASTAGQTLYSNGTSWTASQNIYNNGGNVGIGTPSPSFKLHVLGDIYANGGWLRTSGTAGWYSETYGGGWYMSDTSWIRAYNDKGIYTAGEIQAGTIRGNTSLCISTDCRSSWPSTTSLAWSSITSKPTTISGYGITDAMDLTSSQTPTGIKYFMGNKGAGSYLGANALYPLEAFSNDGGAAAMSFHRAGAYAINMGLDPDNVFRIGGWSAGSNRLQLDMAGNLWTASSMRSSVFYDQDNTAYYNDPASTSNLNTLQLAGNLFVSTSNPTGGGIVLSDDGDIVDLNDGYGSMRFSNGIRIFSANRGGSAAITLGSNGNVYASNYYYNSDITLKKNIVPLISSLQKIRQLNGYSFDWKKDGKHDIGIIAQEVEKVFPELVDNNTMGSGEVIKGVQYGNLVAPLIESTKELADKSDAQEKEIQELKKQITELKEIISHK